MKYQLIVNLTFVENLIEFGNSGTLNEVTIKCQTMDIETAAANSKIKRVRRVRYEQRYLHIMKTMNNKYAACPGINANQCLLDKFRWNQGRSE